MSQTNGKLHIDVLCPKCGAEMTELEFNRKNSGDDFVWESFRKCPKCGTKSIYRSIGQEATVGSQSTFAHSHS